MPKPPREVTEAELAVLQVLWERGPTSIRDLATALYPGGGKSEYATVKTLCERLVGKRCVARDRRRKPHQFRAAIDRNELIGRRLRTVADSLCSGSYAPLISHLMQRGSLTRSEIDELRRQVAELDIEEDPTP